ncbi:TPA: ATP-binding cassette domain-containing protein [Streptococcus suis]|nr:ATP-binding cassette domain-containing protein [Streptococcus suis]
MPMLASERVIKMITHHKQVSMLDCGLACIKTVLSYYDIFPENIDTIFDVKNDQGMSLLDIEETLSQFHIESDSFQVEQMEKLKQLEFPAIAVVNRGGLSHYIVLLGYNEGSFTISDPEQVSFSHISFNDFLSQFSGIVLIPTGNKKILPKFESIIKNGDKVDLYRKFIGTIPRAQKITLWCYGILKLVLPIMMSLVLQFIVGNIFSMPINNQIFIVVIVLCGLLIFKLISSLEIKLKTEIENKLMREVLYDYYVDKIEKFDTTKNYDYVMGYFWNLLSSISGIFQKFYLNIYISILLFSLGILGCLDFKIFLVTLVSLAFLFIYNRYRLIEVENNQRNMVTKSSNFTYLVESSLDGIYDILTFDKADDFKEEFKRRIDELLQVKLDSAVLNTEIATSVQLFTVFTISFLLLSSHLYFTSSSILVFSNIVLLLLLLSTILQPLLTNLVSYYKSKYSLDFITFENAMIEKEVKNQRIGIDTIETIKLKQLSIKFDEKVVFQNLSFTMEKGNIYLIEGDNGAGKSTLIKVLQGILSPTSGELCLNEKTFGTLKHTDITKYVSSYSNEYRLFAGTVMHNMYFDLFTNSHTTKFDFNKFLGLHHNYQVNSQGKNLSLGQQQRLLILRAMVQKNKQVFVFDEPTSNLDEQSRKEFIQMLFELKESGKIICIISHDKDLQSIATDTICLSK